MTQQNEDEASLNNVVPFPRTPGSKCPTAVERASLAEEARRERVSSLASEALDRNKSMPFSQSFVLAKNLRDLIYALKDQGRLDVKDLAPAVRGEKSPREVRAIAEYIVPRKVETEAEYKAKHDRRRLATKPSGYKNLALAAARLAVMDPREAIMKLVAGSSFWPDAIAVAEDERRAAIQVAAVLADLRRPLDAAFSLDRYYDLIKQFEVAPIVQSGQIRFVADEQRPGYEHEAIPAVPIAYQRLAARDVVLVQSRPEDWDPDPPDFDALLRAGRGVKQRVTRRRNFAIGISRLNSELCPIGIFTHDLPDFKGKFSGAVQETNEASFGPRWRNVDVRTDQGLVPGAWRFSDDDLLEEDEERSDVWLQPLDVEFLLADEPGVWHMGSVQQPNRHDDAWRRSADYSGYSRLGGSTSLAGFIERSLAADDGSGGIVRELTSRYRELSGALCVWVDRICGDIERSLEKVRGRLETGDISREEQ